MSQPETELMITWSELRTPSSLSLSVKQCKANLFIVKDHNERVGIMLHDVDHSIRIPEFKHLDIQTSSSKIIRLEDPANEVRLENVLIVIQKKQGGQKFLSQVLNFVLRSAMTNGKYLSQDLIVAMERTRNILEKESADLEGQVGCWGELYLLQLLTEGITSVRQLMMTIQSWEGDDSRTVIDFDFIEQDICIEVKTTIRDKREHHFMSLEQLAHHGRKGFLLSIRCKRSDETGTTTTELINTIKERLRTTEDPSLISLFEDKIEIRGKSVNGNIKFELIQETPLLLYDMHIVPKPSITNDILSVSWNSTLENITPIMNDEYLSIIEKIKNTYE